MTCAVPGMHVEACAEPVRSLYEACAESGYLAACDCSLSLCEKNSDTPVFARDLAKSTNSSRLSLPSPLRSYACSESCNATLIMTAPLCYMKAECVLVSILLSCCQLHDVLCCSALSTSTYTSMPTCWIIQTALLTQSQALDTEHVCAADRFALYDQK